MTRRFALVILIFLLSGCSDNGSERKWPDLGITKNNNNIKKEIIAKCCFRGNVRTIQLGDFISDEKLEVAILGQTGVLFLEAETLNKLEKIKYKDSSGETIWFGLRPRVIIKNKTEFSIMQGGSGFGETGLLDKTGKEKWRFKPSGMNPHAMLSAKLDDGNKTIFYVSDNSGLFQLDITGNINWKSPIKVTDIALYQSIENHTHGLAALDKNSKVIYLVEEDGSIYRKIRLNKKINSFDSVSVNGETLFIARTRNNSIKVIELDGNTLFEYVFENIPIYHGPFSTIIYFKDNRKPNIAVLMQSRSSTGKSLLSIFSLTGSLIYQEVLDGGTGIKEVRGKLIVGDGTKRVWAYH